MGLTYYRNAISTGPGTIHYASDGLEEDDWSDDTQAAGLHSVVQLWNRRKALILFVFLAIVGGIVTWIFLSPRTYEAIVKIFVKRARIETLGGDRDTSSAGPADVSESDIRSEIEILRSRDLLEGVAARSGLAPLSKNPNSVDRLLIARAVQNLEENLRIAPVTKTNIISVRYVSRNPNRAAEILQALTSLYLEKHTALHRSHETSQFFSDQETRYRADLVKAQQKLSDFQQHHEASLLDQRKEINLKRIADLETSLQQIDAETREAMDRAKVLISEKDSLPVMIESQSRTARNEPLLERLKAQLLDLKNRRTEMLTKFEPGYRLVTELDQQIRDTSEALRREEAPAVVDRTDSLNPLRQSAETELSHTESLIAGLAARKQSVLQDLDNCREKQKEMEQLTAEYDDLQRSRSITEQNYLLYEKKTEEAHIADALDQHKFLNVSILEEAAVPVLPMNKHSGFILLLGFILATACAFGSASVADSLDPLIRTPAELTMRTGLPVLAAVFGGGRILSSIGYDGEVTAFGGDQAAEAVWKLNGLGVPSNHTADPVPRTEPLSGNNS
ncbi:MAG: Wzz/FepE/Etk N-terminal domain-containing protein [Bryobacteraceae bacterium]